MLWLWVPGTLLLFTIAIGLFHRLEHGRTRDGDRILVLGCLALACITILIFAEILAA